MSAEQKLTKKEKAEVTRRPDERPNFLPAADIYETAEALILKMDMPGVSREHVDITVEKDQLTIVGKTDPEQTGSAVYRETRAGDYRREFTLTEGIDPDRISADLEAGLLTLTIPKAEKARPQKIPISAAG